MPLYEYECSQCGCFELIRKFSDEPVTACPTCGKPVHKLLSAPAIQFKGAGWYVTDYAGKTAKAERKAKDGGSGATTSEGASKTDGSSKTEGSSKAEGPSKTGTGDSKS